MVRVELDLLLERRRGLYKEYWDRFRSNRLALIFLAVLAVLVVMALVGPYIAPYDPYKADLGRAREPPSLEHPFGTDELGRDILSRILAGARYTIGVSLAAAALGVSIGVLLGLVSGFYRGSVDTVIMRIVDVMMAFPAILLAILLATVLGQGVYSLIVSIAVTSFPVYARLTRSVALQVVIEDFISASRLLGEGSLHIMLRHVLPNIISPIIVQATYHAGQAVLLVSSLGFLGLGIKPPTPEWEIGRAHV